MTQARGTAADGRPALDQPMIDVWRAQAGHAVECPPFRTDVVAAVASAVPFVERLADS